MVMSFALLTETNPELALTHILTWGQSPFNPIRPKLLEILAKTFKQQPHWLYPFLTMCIPETHNALMVFESLFYGKPLIQNHISYESS